ncbi:putative quercetin 2,3-dioxygenase VC_A0969 [Vibrio crassostreae]|nr:putative quercetin 2,3-dioxygenase VC_A0969 [Vibrio crassostreae]CAK2693384.1 putative quercetin 2,3-dioxygenase VC_A0969 [Vibrio crassostreae]CAK2694328.1 putative quercetin 2,3-dioxygenase VC_A0969 [Vibrio crassostreae]CAK2697856.1 putative quercetin 2,3-dioxygenase VC_A0969 [Vibrio crassostreae]CAK2701198.1 putative quercetin 2,3-dioxygenase VC_A0969 [Vibrio crassostreae]
MNKPRTLIETLNAKPTSDGAGVKIQRIAGFNIKQFSPFLMIDELRSDKNQDYVGGFPPHPHRGIETFSYMLKGHFQHKDSLGNSGELRSGGAQWMASGKGIIHSEMPMMEEGQLHGFQIWINQPSQDKKSRARYADFQPEMITELKSPELGTARVLAGESTINDIWVESALEKSGVPVNVIDWRASTNQQLHTTIEESFNAMVYVYKGAIEVSGKVITQGQLGFLSQGDSVHLTAAQGSGVFILAGQPITEPVVHYGPFVMNSMDEINQAISDYNQGLFDTYK